MKNLQNQRFGILLSGVMIVLFLAYGSEWLRMVNTTSARTATDFMAFYAGGRVADRYGFPAAYSIELQQNVQEAVLGFELAEGQVLLYNHVPHILPILSGVVDEDYAGSFARWAILLLFIYLTGTAYLVRQLFPQAERATRLLTAGAVITFLPLFISLWQGQDTAFVYLGAVLWCVGMLKKQGWLMAAGVALATVRPHIAIALGLPILFKHRQAVWQTAGLGALLLLFCLWLFTWDGILGFLQLIRISAEGTWFGMKPEAMFNLLGLTVRVLPFLDPGTVNMLSWVIYAIGLALICALWLRSQEMNERLLGLTILIAVLFAPHLHLHDLTLLVFPSLFVAMEWSRNLSRLPVAIFLLGATLVFLMSFLMPALYHVLPYLLCFLLAGRLLAQTQPQKT